jgi:hypothetical protein
MPQPFLHLVIFQIDHHFCLVKTMSKILLPMPPHSWDCRSEPPWPVCWDEILLTFCLIWPQTAILPISTSRVAGITDENHHVWPVQIFYKYTLQPLYNHIYGRAN